MIAPAVEQLRREVGDRTAGLAGLLVSADSHLAHTTTWEHWERFGAQVLVGQLAVDAHGTDHDQRVSAQTCIDVLNALWPAELDPPDDWWLTPLGRLCAASLGVDGSEMVSVHVAAAMLAIHPSEIGSLLATGRLDRHPDGGVVASSVYRFRSGGGGGLTWSERQ